MTNEFRRRSKLQQFHFEAQSKGSPAVKTCQFSDECIASHKCVCESVCVCVCLRRCVLWWRAEKPKIFIQFAKVARRVTHTPRLPLARTLSCSAAPASAPRPRALGLTWRAATCEPEGMGLGGCITCPTASQTLQHYALSNSLVKIIFSSYFFFCRGSSTTWWFSFLLFAIPLSN